MNNLFVLCVHPASVYELFLSSRFFFFFFLGGGGLFFCFCGGGGGGSCCCLSFVLSVLLSVSFFLVLCRPCEIDDVVNFAFLRSKHTMGSEHWIRCARRTRKFLPSTIVASNWFAVLRWMSAHTVVVRKEVGGKNTAYLG